MGRSRIQGAPTAVIAVHTPLLLVPVIDVLAEAEVRIVGTAYVPTSLRVVELLQPDVLVSEVTLPTRTQDRMRLEFLREFAPRVRLVAILPEDDPALIGEFVGAGAAAYVLSETEPSDLAIAIRQLFHQVIFIADDYVAERDGPPLPLTRRETLILRLVAEGYTNHEVATRLKVSEPTVKFHLTNVFRKLGVGNRTEASSWARRRGLTLLVPDDVEDVDDVAVRGVEGSGEAVSAAF